MVGWREYQGGVLLAAVRDMPRSQVCVCGVCKARRGACVQACVRYKGKAQGTETFKMQQKRVQRATDASWDMISILFLSSFSRHVSITTFPTHPNKPNTYML